MNTRMAVIMAGGSGERFWPLSRQQRPKQLLKLTNANTSLLNEAIDRIAPLVQADRVYVATGRHLEQAIRSSDTDVPDANVVAEPCKRNTAGCLIYIAAVLLARHGDAGEDLVMGIMPADHQIGDADAYRRAIDTAYKTAETNDMLVTLGIRPTRPETGYGYIEVDAGACPLPNTSAEQPAYKVARFREKPDQETAVRFLATGCYFWNSGLFFWRIRTFLNELKQAAPETHCLLLDIVAALKDDNQQAADELFAQLESISIDYLLLERARRVAVVPAEFTWDDVGAWDALDRTLERDDSGNVNVGDSLLIDTHDCIVYNEPGAETRTVAVVGAHNLVVVVSEDAVLVVPKSRVQDVKAAVTELKKRDSKSL